MLLFAAKWVPTGCAYLEFQNESKLLMSLSAHLEFCIFFVDISSLALFPFEGKVFHYIVSIFYSFSIIDMFN